MCLTLGSGKLDREQYYVAEQLILELYYPAYSTVSAITVICMRHNFVRKFASPTQIINFKHLYLNNAMHTVVKTTLLTSIILPYQDMTSQSESIGHML